MSTQISVYLQRLNLSASQDGTCTRYDHFTAPPPKNNNKSFPRLRFGKQQGNNTWENLHLEEETSKITQAKTTTTNSPTIELTGATEDTFIAQTTQEPYEAGGTQENW